MKKIFIILSILITILFYLSIIKISESPKSVFDNFKIVYKKIDQTDDNQIGYIKIDSLNLDEKLYKVDSPENTVDKHVTILKESVFPDNDNSIVFIAAHSGTGDIAYFKNLDLIKENDIIILNLNNKNYEYYVKEMWEDPKNGYININKEEKNQLILTTCSPHNSKKQLIVNCIEKEPN